MTRWRALLRLGWLAACCLLAAFGARAAERLDLGSVDNFVDLASRVELLEDPGAEFRPAQALVQPGWHRADPLLLSLGVTSSAIWLRLELVNQEELPQTRWVTLGSARLEHVHYFRFASDLSQPVETASSGLAYPLEGRAVPGLVSIFPVTLEAGESATLLLRVSGRTRLFLAPAIWEPLAYRAFESDKVLRQLVPIFALLGVALYMLVRVVAYRSGDMLLLAVWLAFMALFEMSFGGHLYRFLLHQGGEAAVRSTLVLSNLCLVLGACFTLQYLALHQRRGWKLAYGAFIIASLCLAGQAALGDLLLANAISGYLLLVFFLFWPISIAWAWYRGAPNAGLFLLATSGMWVAIVLRVTEQMGWIPLDSLPDDSLTIRPTLVLALVMVFVVIRSTHAEQRSLRETQAALLKSRQQEQLRLEFLVRERTQTLQDAVIAADEANRARGELLARINHDLRQPVEEIVALAQPLEQSELPQAEYGGAIRRSASALVELIDDLIDEVGSDSRLGTIRPEPIDMRRLLGGLVVEAEGLALSNGNTFAWHPETDLPDRVLADPKRVRQVLINLLDNAAKYTRNGLVEFWVDSVVEGSQAHLTFTVSDTGVGMRADQLQVIFEPFWRTESSHGQPGQGLGLAITRHWVERMGGNITVSSVPGRGTTMRVSLAFDLPAGEVQAQALVGSEAQALVRPDAGTLAPALDLLRLGAISDLHDWATGLAASRPDCLAFAQRVADLAERGDLKGLSLCLCDQAA
jgi:signal transduction histidine kinase